MLLKNKIYSLNAFARCLIFFALLGVAGSSSSQEESATDYQQRLKKLQDSIKELQQQLDQVKGNRADLQKQLENNEKEISDLIKKIDGIKEEIKVEEQKLSDLKRKRSSLVDAQLAQKHHIAQQVQAAYRLGQQSNIKLLLNQNSPEKVSRMLKYYDYILAARADKLSAYVDNLNQLTETEASIHRNTDALNRKQQRLQSEYQQLQSKQQQRQTTLARLNDTIDNKDQELEQLARQRADVEKLLAKVSAVLGSRPFSNSNAPFAKQRGKLAWPTNGTIAHRYGSYRVPGKLKWEGVVIRAAEGSPVRAIHQGRVAVASYLNGLGLFIIIDHGDGYHTLYAHNQTLLRQEGSWVEAGEIIASVGNSGGQQQAGLYFEIRHNIETLNPSQWCG